MFVNLLVQLDTLHLYARWNEMCFVSSATYTHEQIKQNIKKNKKHNSQKNKAYTNDLEYMTKANKQQFEGLKDLITQTNGKINDL